MINYKNRRTLEEEEEEEAIRVARQAEEKELEIARALASMSEDDSNPRSPMKILTSPSPDKISSSQPHRFDSISQDK